MTADCCARLWSLGPRYHAELHESVETLVTFVVGMCVVNVSLLVCCGSQVTRKECCKGCKAVNSFIYELTLNDLTIGQTSDD